MPLRGMTRERVEKGGLMTGGLEMETLRGSDMMRSKLAGVCR